MLELLILIEPHTLIAFSLTAFALVVTPGPDTMLILHRSTVDGKAFGLATVAGVQVGLIFHTLLAIFGVSVLIASSPVLFKGIALMGSLYLLWLASQSIRNSSSKTGEKIDITRPTKLKAFMDSMLCNILNPKVILMYLALMPNFIKIELGNLEQQLLLLGLIMISINIGWQVPLSIVASTASRFLKNPQVKRNIDVAAGVTLTLFAILMFYDNIL